MCRPTCVIVIPAEAGIRYLGAKPMDPGFRRDDDQGMAPGPTAEGQPPLN
jgi:hypothetical protein